MHYISDLSTKIIFRTFSLTLKVMILKCLEQNAWSLLGLLAVCDVVNCHWKRLKNIASLNEGEFEFFIAKMRSYC